MSENETDLMGNSIETFTPEDNSPSIQNQSEEDFQIEVVDDRPDEDRVDPREGFDSDGSSDHDEEVRETGTRAEKRISKLKYEFHEERRAKEAAERMKDEAIRYAEQQRVQNDEMRKVLERGEEVLLSEIRSRTKADIDRARQSYQAAVEDGDSGKILEAQELLNRAQIENYNAETYTPQAEPRSQAEYAPQGQQHQPPQADPSQDPKLQSWLSQNNWFGQDDEMTSFAMGVHKKLTEKDGVSPTTDEYYNQIDARMRSVFPGYFGEGSNMGEEEPSASPAPSVVAPATRSSNNSRKVQLTSTQVALAKRLGLTPQQYAKQVIKETNNV
jgi:hypothetical protein|tara:strand:+ start:1814 stop:2800 length:987 start_codon:yes stop_codon:yes gene_type:complete